MKAKVEIFTEIRPNDYLHSIATFDSVAEMRTKLRGVHIDAQKDRDGYRDLTIDGTAWFKAVITLSGGFYD